METENSVWFFRGKEARRMGESMAAGFRLRGLNRSAWDKGWLAQDAEIKKAGRTPEVVAEFEAGATWFAEELAKWGQA